LIGVKMLLSEYVQLPTAVALAGVAGVLAVSVMLSLVFPKKEGAK
jgi:tellurite resistance protein TerC